MASSRARCIDSTALNPDATKDDIERLCVEARTLGFKTVCINPSWVRLAADLLKDSDTGVCTVIGFPLGATLAAAKVFEAKESVLEGADEIDMVINIGRLKSGDSEYVEDEIAQVKKAIGKRILKVIIECCLLTDGEKRKACLLAQKAGADFVKTSTGFSKSGATVHDVALMRETVGPTMGVKAAGGIRDKETMEAMLKAGATRIGTSHGAALIK